MKRLFLIIACLASVLAAGTGLKAQEVTITLMPGWTWISVPSTETMDFATALGSFTPAVGDRIKSQWGIATYRGDGEWRGQISEFYPGYGYKYYSARMVPVTVTMGEPLPFEAVSTAEPTGVTATGATVGGTVSVGEGNHVFVRGVCWGTEETPDVDGSHTTGAAEAGSQTVSLDGLTPNTTYHVRAYMVTDHGLSYGEAVSFTTREGIPTVTTAAVTGVTGNSALCGGTVTDDGGLAITARGVCWSTSHNPTLGDSHTTNGTGTGSFTSTITGLNASTTYYVRAYASNSLVTIYGGEQSFTTEAGGGSGGDHAYVDLGLPSGLLWATCNVGADNPEGYGDYFAWGETQPKDTYDWSNYQYCNGSDNTLTKYCNDSDYGYSGFTDNLTTLLPEDDVATANWGSEWRMPTKEEWQELYQNTTHTWTTQDGVNGRLFTASNGNSIFLPAAGYRSVDELYEADHFSYYWSSSIGTNPNGAWYFDFDSVYYGVNCNYRDAGQSVRAVRSGTQNTAPTGAINGKFTINDDGDQVYFSQGNLQYQASTNTWRFAENQWDFVGGVESLNNNYSFGNVFENGVKCNNNEISATYSGWIDLFGWGTSGYNHGATCYQPWSISDDSDVYNVYGTTDKNLYDETGMADWGYNAIANGGNQENYGWRTLTKEEWSYLIDERTTPSNARFAKANVNGVDGILILPDNWSLLIFPLNDVNAINGNYINNTIDLDDWESVLQYNGVVFLPAAGQRLETYPWYDGWDRINYWSSSYYYAWESYYACFDDSGSFSPNQTYFRCYGLSVRLVRNAE